MAIFVALNCANTMYLKNEHITLRALEPEDLEHFYRWENDTALWSVSSAVEPYSRYVLKQYLTDADKTIYEKKQLRLMIERNADKAVVGAVDLFDFDVHHLRAGVGVLVDKQFQYQGFGGEALELLIAYAFGFLKLKQLYAHVPVTNAVSKSLFAKVHFEHTGTLKSWIRQGDDFIDVEVLQRVQ